MRRAGAGKVTKSEKLAAADGGRTCMALPSLRVTPRVAVLRHTARPKFAAPELRKSRTPQSCDVR